MEHSKKRIIITTVIGSVLFVIGLTLLIVGLNIKRPVITYYDSDETTVFHTEKVAIGKTGDITYRPQKPCETPGYVYVFKGWHVDYTDELVQFVQVTEDRPYKAVAEFDKAIYSYEISYDLDKGYFPTSVNPLYKYTVKESYVLPEPAKPGYDFKGWYSKNTLYNEIKTGTTGDLKLKAKWELHTYNIDYVLDGGTVTGNPTEYKINADDIVLINPTRENYTFDGWYDQNGKPIYVISDDLIGDLVLTAKWVKVINYYLDGGANSFDAPTKYEIGTTISLTNPTKFGYEFKGWYTSSDFSGEAVTSIYQTEPTDISLYAKWEKVIDNLVFEEDGKNYIYFGRYPQTVVTDYDVIKELEVLCKESDSCVYNGDEYVKLKATPATSSKFNNPVQNMLNGSLNVTSTISSLTYYFKVEPIKWRVLSSKDGKLELLCEYALDASVFGQEQTLNGKKSYANNYENSVIRSWLNDDFYNQAFSADEKNYINTTLVDNSSLSTSSKTDNKYVSNNTNDKVYLLSYKQATSVKNGFISSYDEVDVNKACITTDYARAKGAVMNLSNEYFGYTNWMLRSPFDNNQNGISVVVGLGNETSEVNTVALWYSCTTKLAVRPAITITLE